MEDIPVFKPLIEQKEKKSDYIFILPWNLTNEIMDQLSFIREWEGKFVTPVTDLNIL